VFDAVEVWTKSLGFDQQAPLAQDARRAVPNEVRDEVFAEATRKPNNPSLSASIHYAHRSFGAYHAKARTARAFVISEFSAVRIASRLKISETVANVDQIWMRITTLGGSVLSASQQADIHTAASLR